MSRNTIKNNLIEAKQILDQFLANEETLDNIEKAAQMMIKSIQAGGKIISCGNGGSMCDAMHFAEELTGRFRENRKPIAALSISDASHITCVGNDYGFDEIFSRYIQGVGSEGDVLLAISTSGNSRNIIRAAEDAKLKKMKIVALTGKDGGKLSSITDVEIRAPFSKFADRAQEIHIKVIHSLIQYIEENC
ncbi:MAG: D-sedoheptulose 7-phosphate isomerase [Flavobacteriales bacterium]|nr:D-sedoheptulose 7-phosphate isomerase [Flavobacteriales bacterium]